MSDIDQIRRAHASARPTPENPAWMNYHRDCGVLLGEIEGLRAVLSGRARWQEIERLRAIETAALRIASLHADDDGDYIVTAELMRGLNEAVAAADSATTGAPDAR